jgi:hypothetical protein
MSMWQSLSKFAPLEEVVGEFLRCIKMSTCHSPEIQLNRQIGREPVIAQLSAVFESVPPDTLRIPGTPWIIRFRDEQGIDAGGLMREAFVFATDSVFKDGFVMRRSENDPFVPFCRNFQQNKTIYHAIGILIGMIVRVGLPGFPVRRSRLEMRCGAAVHTG